MSEVRVFNGEKTFLQPERPFLLLTEDVEGSVSYYWWDNEENIRKDATERINRGEKIVTAIEISSCRNVDI